MGNLILRKDVEDNFKAIIIPVKHNGMFTQDKDLGFKVWCTVDIQSIEVIN